MASHRGIFLEKEAKNFFRTNIKKEIQLNIELVSVETVHLLPSRLQYQYILHSNEKGLKNLLAQQ